MAGKRRKTCNKNLEELADLLIARHLRLSVPQSAVRDRLAETQHPSVYPVEKVERQMRCIAIVGAGASAPLLERSNELAKTLERDFGRDETELERLVLVNNLRRKEFETRLVALSRTPAAAREVRQVISEKYAIRHPPVLAYELLAHLTKHRFLDAIISFNFDELLDQSLEDELGGGEFTRVVSDRDCIAVQSDPDARDYVPLYVKLHGTASEPDSLRFTPESYYSLPTQVARLVTELLHTEQCVIVNVGSGLGTFDFQRLLRAPERLDVFNLSLDPIPKRVKEKIKKERKPEKRREKKRKWLHECSTGGRACDAQLRKLAKNIERQARGKTSPQGSRSQLQQLVKLRSVLRHEAVVQLLGPGRTKGKPVSSGQWTKQAQRDYLRRRTILELAFAGAKARGLLSLAPLASDRPARYYDEYRRLTNGNGEDWGALCSAAGLQESRELPDVLVSTKGLENRKAKRSKTKTRRETHRLHEFHCGKLASQVLARVKNPADPADFKLLKKTIKSLQDEADVELHTQDDRVCSKAFKRPVTLTTPTSLQAYTWLMFRDLKPHDRIYMISETGAWLTRKPIQGMLKDQRKMRVLLAFDLEGKALRKKYGKPGKRLDQQLTNPWHHNRHMTIVCRRDRPIRAIYFARHLRTPVITAVYLDSIRDVQRMMEMHQTRWDEAKRTQKKERRR